MSKLIRLRGKYAVGKHTHAIVDDDMYEELNRYKWKAKPNGDKNHIYAIRTTKRWDKTVDVRMHREVIDAGPFDGTNDVDHINRNALDNRRQNLRICTRSVNTKNTTDEIKERRREWARKYQPIASAISAALWKQKPKKQRPAQCRVSFGDCALCGAAFASKTARQKFCSHRCKERSREGNRQERKRMERERAGIIDGPVYLCAPHVCSVSFKTCKGCGKPFTARNGQARYCNPYCGRSVSGRTNKRMYLCMPHTSKVSFGNCLECDKPFASRTVAQRYCGSKCKDRHRRRATGVGQSKFLRAA